MDGEIKDYIKEGKYEHITKGLKYSDDLIDLVERMMDVVYYRILYII
jgi:hypothetical protein